MKSAARDGDNDGPDQAVVGPGLRAVTAVSMFATVGEPADSGAYDTTVKSPTVTLESLHKMDRGRWPSLAV